MLERYGLEFKEPERTLLDAPSKDALQRLHEMKRDALLVRRRGWPQREGLNDLMRDPISS
ncbi:MAG: magnesium transporter [Gammaproteobacteria bacterium]